VTAFDKRGGGTGGYRRITSAGLGSPSGEQRFGGPERLSGVDGVTDYGVTTDVVTLEREARRLVEHVNAENGQQLFGFVRRLGIGDEEAGDITQEALLRLWRACLDGRAPDRPAAWAFRTAYRLAMDRHRVRRRLGAFLGGQRTATPQPADRRDDLLAVWSEVDRLPVRQRQVLYLRYRSDLPFEDIATVLGIDASSARGSATRGIAALRDRLAGKDD
jgi:RNA polymerase sigma factor (sigma-70 family)